MKLLYPEFLILLFGLLFLYRANSKPKKLYLALFFMIVALSRPVMTKALHEEKSEGVEAVVALDLSYSMRASDILPSRLEAAKESIKKLFRQNLRNRYALYGFTTNALILSPPTQDYTLLEAALDSIQEENILTHGTSLRNLLEKLAKRQIPVKNVVILTDGGEENDLDGLLQIAQNAGMRLIIVGMATERGTLLKDSYGKVLKDKADELVVTRLNPLLKPLAAKSGGWYLSYETPETTAHKIAQRLDSVAGKSLFSHKEQQYRDLFWIPLLAALGLFLLYFVEIPKKWLALLPFVALSSDASVLDWYYLHEAESAYIRGDYARTYDALEQISTKTLQLAYDQALAAYKMRQYKKALTILDSLETTDADLKFKILFMRGNAQVRLKQYSKAREAYQQALILKRDPDVLYNLKVILGKKDYRQRKPPGYKKEETQKDGVASRQKKRQKQKKKGSGGKGKRQKVSRPLGYKAYELINKGYIDEKKPW